MEDVRPFLDNVLRGLPVPRERYEAVVHHYELIGGKSPLNELTRRQAEGLRGALRDDGFDLGVYVGMRFAKPYVFTAIRDMVRDGRRRVVAIVLAPYRSEPSWEKYREAVAEVLDAVDPATAPEIAWVEPWFDHPGFAEAQADRVREERWRRSPNPDATPPGSSSPRTASRRPSPTAAPTSVRSRRPAGTSRPASAAGPGSSIGRAGAAIPGHPGSSPTSMHGWVN